MATLYCVNGTQQEITPANGREFTPLELRQYVGGGLTDISLTRRIHLYLADESLDQPVNEAATRLLAFHRPDLAHVVLHGNVVAADIAETGDDEG